MTQRMSISGTGDISTFNGLSLGSLNNTASDVALQFYATNSSTLNFQLFRSSGVNDDISYSNLGTGDHIFSCGGSEEFRVIDGGDISTFSDIGVGALNSGNNDQRIFFHSIGASVVDPAVGFEAYILRPSTVNGDFLLMNTGTGGITFDSQNGVGGTITVEQTGRLDMGGFYKLPAVSPAATGKILFSAGTGGTLTWSVYTFPAADGTSGQVLKTNGSGTVSWAADGKKAFEKSIQEQNLIIQEQAQTIEILQSEIEQLKTQVNKIDALQKEINEIKATINNSN